MSPSIHVDQLARSVTLSGAPRRIVSLVPSITELLFDLNLASEVVGVTRFCVHPIHARKDKTIVGGTKKFDFAKIDALQPDLIIGNKEENYPEGIFQLAEKYPVWMSDVNTYNDALRMIAQLGEVTGRIAEANELVSRINLGFAGAPFFQRTRVAYLIWREPWMAVGSDTFIHSMMEKIGLENVLHSQPRYPEVTLSQLRDIHPDAILLSSEPFPFKEEHKRELHQQLPGIKIRDVDGEMFSWYGSRMVLAATYFKSLVF